MPIEVGGTASSQVTIELKDGDRVVPVDVRGNYLYELTEAQEALYETNEPIPVVHKGDRKFLPFPIVQSPSFELTFVGVSSVTETAATISWITTVAVGVTVEWGTDGENYPNKGAYLAPRASEDYRIGLLPGNSEIYVQLVFPDRTIQLDPFRTQFDSTPISVNFVEDTIGSNTHTFRWTDSDPNPSADPPRRYDLYLNGVDQGPSRQYPTLEWTVDTLPVDGSFINAEIQYWDNDDDSQKRYERATFTAHKEVIATGPLTFDAGPTVDVISQSDVLVNFTASDYVYAQVEIATIPGVFYTAASHNSSFEYATHRMPIRDLRASTAYAYRVTITDANGNSAVSTSGTFTTNGAVDPSGLREMTFSQIAAAGLPYAIYEDSNEDLAKLQWGAEFAYQNRDVVRLYSVDMGRRTVTQLPTSTAPANATVLPAPSGGDDTSALEAAMSGGGTFVGHAGSARYRISRLELKTPGTILFDLLYENINNGPCIEAKAADVELHNVTGRGANSQATIGFSLHSTAPRCTMIDCEWSDVTYTGGGGRNVIGVYINGADRAYIAGGEFKNLLNRSGSDSTHRANAFWVHGGSARRALPRVTVVAVKGENLESNGRLRDAEFMTIQTHSTGRRTVEQSVKVLACELFQAGKRGIKCQDDGCIMLSTYVLWDSRTTEVGDSKGRYMLHVWSAQDDADDCYFRHTRVKISGGENWNVGLNVQPNSQNPTNIHCDRNEFIVDFAPPNESEQSFARFRPKQARKYSTSGCSLSGNRLQGVGGINEMYRLYDGNTFSGWNTGLNVMSLRGNPSRYRETRTS